jgi:hypothetical protein
MGADGTQALCWKWQKIIFASRLTRPRHHDLDPARVRDYHLRYFALAATTHDACERDP